MDKSDQLQAEVVLPQRKNNQVPTEHKERWEPELVWTLLRRGKSLDPLRNRIKILPSASPQNSHCSNGKTVGYFYKISGHGNRHYRQYYREINCYCCKSHNFYVWAKQHSIWSTYSKQWSLLDTRHVLHLKYGFQSNVYSPTNFYYLLT